MKIMIVHFLLLFSVGCGALNTARPLDKGQQTIGATFGGLVITQLGPPMPLPFLIVEGQTGLSPIKDRPFDINYGLNATALAFGTLGLHLGASHLLLEQKGYRPALSAMERVHFYNNYFDTTKSAEVRSAFFLNQIDLTASWKLQRNLTYVGVANYLDFADPELNITPFVGWEYQSKKRMFTQMEIRYLAANRSQDIDDIAIFGGTTGGLSTTLSIGWKMGGEK
jgi:hypothetical protein